MVQTDTITFYPNGTVRRDFPRWIWNTTLIMKAQTHSLIGKLLMVIWFSSEDTLLKSEIQLEMIQMVMRFYLSLTMNT